MSSPDAAAGPYAGNDKKPIGGNIMAHASTTRFVDTFPCFIICMLICAPDSNSERGVETLEFAKFMTRLAYPRVKHTSLSLTVVLGTLKRRLECNRRLMDCFIYIHQILFSLSFSNSVCVIQTCVQFTNRRKGYRNR